MLSEALAFDEDARETFDDVMSWPTEIEDRTLAAQDETARAAAGIISGANVDSMFQNLMRERARYGLDQPVETVNPDAI